MKDNKNWMTNIKNLCFGCNNNTVFNITADVSEEKLDNQNKKFLEKLSEIRESIEKIFRRSTIFYISEEDKNSLQEADNKISLLVDTIVEENMNENSLKSYYLILFELDLLIDPSKIIFLYEEKIPKKFKYEEKFLRFYMISLLFKDRFEDALDVSRKLKDINEEVYFVFEIECLFFLKRFQSVKFMTKALHISKYDKDGYIAMYEILSKDKLKKMTREEIIGYNSKFKNFPLFNSLAARLLFELNPKDKKIKDYVRQALNFLDQSEDIELIIRISEQLKEMGFDHKIGKTLMSKSSLSTAIVMYIFKVYDNITEIEEEELFVLDELINYAKDNKIDSNNIEYRYGDYCYKAGKKIKALHCYEKIFVENKDANLALKCLTLIVECNSFQDIDIDKFFSIIIQSNDVSIMMKAALLYKNLNRIIESYKLAVKSICMNSNEKMNTFLLGSFCNIFCEEQDFDDLILNEENKWIIIENLNDKTKRDVLITNYIDNENINYDALILGIKNNNYLELKDILVNECFSLDGCNYKVIEINKIYEYFLQLFFHDVSENKYENVWIKRFSFSTDNDELGGIKNYLREIRDKNAELFRRYDIEKNEGEDSLTLTISSLTENFDYFPVIQELLNNEKYKMYAGDIVRYSIDEKFVLDPTTISFLAFIGELNNLSKFSKQLYVTQSTYNKFNRIRLESKKLRVNGLRINCGEDDQLYRTEITKEDKERAIEFNRNIIRFLNKCKIVEHESTFKYERFDKTQLDSIDFALSKKYVYVCDDLMMRKLFIHHFKGEKSTNSLFFIEEMMNKHLDEYLDCILKLSKANYIYCIDESSIDKLVKAEQEYGLNEDFYYKFENIVDNIYRTEFLFRVYFEIFKDLLRRKDKYRQSKLVQILFAKSFYFLNKYKYL